MRKEKPDLLAIENGLHAEGFALICGVDERFEEAVRKEKGGAFPAYL